MANRPQNASKGLFSKARIHSDLLQIGGVSTATIEADTTGNLDLGAGVQLSGVSTGLLTANSTGLVAAASTISANSVLFRTASNSTGSGIQINTTGTTWLWVSTTSVGPA